MARKNEVNAPCAQDGGVDSAACYTLLLFSFAFGVWYIITQFSVVFLIAFW